MTEREKSPDDEPELSLDEMLDLVTPENQHGSLWDVPAGDEFGELLRESAEHADSTEPVAKPPSEDVLALLRARSEAYRKNPSAVVPLDEALERIERTLE